MNVLERHERANRAIREVDARLAETVAARADGRSVSRPPKIHPLPTVDLGTRDGCDRTMVALGRRIQQIEGLDADGELGAARERALGACRELAEAVREQRANLAFVD